MGKYLNMIRQAEKTHTQTGQDKEPVQVQSGPVEALPIVPGTQITWRADGKPRGPATVDFLHADPDGTVWAFVTLVDGWAAVNTKHVTKTEEGPA